MDKMTLEKPKKKKKTLTPAKVQTSFNQAIVRRDGRCILSGGTDNPQCSHFFAVGGSGALRFYPPNAHTQTAGVHINFHNRDVLPYTEWMQENVPQLDWMKTARKATIHYGQGSLTIIQSYCKEDRLTELTAYIYELIEAEK